MMDKIGQYEVYNKNYIKRGGINGNINSWMFICTRKSKE